MSEDSMTERSQMAAAAPRRLMHQLTVVCDGYLRHYGLWEVDARLRDTKTFSYVHFARGPLDPGAAVHDMTLRLTVDDQLTLRDIDTEMATTPLLTCQDVRPAMRDLIGIRLISGWRGVARERIGRLQSCTTILALKVPAITTPHQHKGIGQETDRRP